MIGRKLNDQDLVSVYVDGSHKYQRHHKEVSALLPQKKPTANLNATYNSDFQWIPLIEPVLLLVGLVH